MYTVGLIGVGYWGSNYLRVFNELSGARLKWVSDIQTERLADVRDRYPGVETTTEYTDICEDDDVDAVCIATPPSTHYDLTTDVLESGKHVLVEKPFTLDTGRAEELTAMADTLDRTVVVGHIFEYNAAVRSVRERIVDDELGEVLNVSSLRTGLGPIRNNVSALWDLAPHDISTLTYLLDASVDSVRCLAHQYLADEPDSVYLLLEFSNGVTGFVHCSWLHPRKVREMSIVGDEKMAVFNDTDPERVLQIYDNEIDRTEQPDGLGEFQYTVRGGDVLLPNVELREPLKVQVEHFLDCIETGATPLTGPAEGTEVVRVLEQAEASMRSDGERKYI